MKKRRPQKKSDQRFSPHAGQKAKSSSISASQELHIPIDEGFDSVSGAEDRSRTDFSLTTGAMDASVRISHAASNTIAS